MSTENTETAGSLADRITKPDESVQPATSNGMSLDPQSPRTLFSLFQSRSVTIFSSLREILLFV